MSDSSKASTNSESHYETWKSDWTVKAIAHILNEISIDNKLSLESLEDNKFPFNSRKIPQISIQNYIERIVKYTHLEESSLVIALIYLDKICESCNVLITEFNIHRILFLSIILAIKNNEDDFYSNSYYAKVGGINVQEMNKLEYEFIKMVDFKFFVTNEIYEKYLNYLLHYHVKN